MKSSAAPQRWNESAHDSIAPDGAMSGPLTVQAILAAAKTGYALCFHALDDAHCAFAFPCDADGRVDIDSLSDHARHEYLYARALIGRILARPAVCTP